MRVLVTDRKYPERQDPYGDTVAAHGGEIAYRDLHTEAELIEECQGYEAFLTFKAPFTRQVIESLGDAALILRIGTGVDTIDIAAATDCGIPVSNAPGYSTQDIATHAITLLLGAARDVARSDRDMREQNGFGRRSEIKRSHGQTLGIVGLGRIGRAAVPKAQGLGMEVIACDPYLPDDVFDLLGVERVTFGELLDRSDYVSVHAPLTAETHHLFGAAEFERMKDDAVFANTARGPIVDEEALVDAVESGEIRAAGIDVFATEPPADSPALGCDRIICSPHHGGNAPESDDECVDAVCAELGRVLAGEHLRNVINPEVFKYGSELLSPEF